MLRPSSSEDANEFAVDSIEGTAKELRRPLTWKNSRQARRVWWRRQISKGPRRKEEEEERKSGLTLRCLSSAAAARHQ